MTNLLLDGLVVLDLSRYASGPSATQLLADHGARVIKLEPPTGDPFRSEGPAEIPDGVGGYFLRFNRNKESVVCDLTAPEGIEVLLDLVRKVDVIVENFKPGFLSSRGIAYEQLSEVNPRLILASISGFGSEDVLPSPDSGRAAFAVIAEAEGGIINRIGEPDCRPHWSGVSLGDLNAGTMTVVAILMALFRREKTGVGDHIDLAMTDVMIALNERAILMTSLTGSEPERGQASSMVGPLPCADGYVVAGVVGRKRWAAVCDLVGGPDLVASLGTWRGEWMDFKTNIVVPRIESWLADKTSEEAVGRLEAIGVPSGIVKNASQVISSPHARARHMMVDLEYPGVGKCVAVASPIVTLRSDRVAASGPPLLGEHTVSVLSELLDYSPNRVDELLHSGVIIGDSTSGAGLD